MFFSSPIEIIKSPLWGNTYINIPTQYQWFKFGILEVGDLFKNGVLLTREELNNRVQGVVPFITYGGISEAIPRSWKETIEENFQTSQNLYLNKFQEIVMADAKGCRTIRNFTQTKFIETTWIDKWNNSLEVAMEDHHWTSVYKSLSKLKISPNVIYFQYQTITRSLITNRKLFQFKIRENDLCSYCSDSPETIEHLLYRCPMVMSLWSKIQKWCQDNNYNNVNLEENFILLGAGNLNQLLQTLINNTKHIIYKYKFKGKMPALKYILNTWKNCMDIEGYIAMSNNKTKTFLGKWSPLYILLKDL